MGEEFLKALGLVPGTDHVSRLVIDIDANKEVSVAIHRFVTIQQMEAGIKSLECFKLVPKE